MRVKRPAERDQSGSASAVRLVLIVAITLLFGKYFVYSSAQEAEENRVNLHQQVAHRQTASVVRPVLKKKKKPKAPKPVTYSVFQVLAEDQECGMPWSKYYEQLKAPASNDELFIWTVSGGRAYREAADMLLTKWKSLDIFPVLLIALDEATAKTVCAAGYPAVYWDLDQTSYSKVADSKFVGGSQLAERGHTGFFIELDVFCRANPMQIMLDKLLTTNADLAVIGHGDVAYQPNIGVWLAKPTMGPFFRGIAAVLSYSKDNERYSNWNERKKKFFDQEVMNNCKERSTDDQVLLAKMRVKYFLPEDAETKENDLMNHCNKTRLKFELIDHSIIQSHDPPTVYDSTICIHPLMPVPFVPFEYKFAAAKFLGFDPAIRENERLLKIDHGDYTCNECWGTSWFTDQLDSPRFQQLIKYHITAMAVFANETKRTLVLPRYMRDKDAFGVPILSVIDVGTLKVPWRFMSIEESREIPPDDLETIELTRETDEPDLLKQIDSSQARVVALRRICMLAAHQPDEMVTKPMEDIRFCVEKGFLKFTKGVGGWSKMCFIDQCKVNPISCA